MKDLAERTKDFALRIIRLSNRIPRTRAGNVIAHQLLRSGTSVGAHYHESVRSRSNAELISKIEVALQELDETGYWLQLLAESKTVAADRLEAIRQEVDELIAILVTSVKTVKKRKKLAAK